MCRNQWIFLIPPCLPALHFGNFVYFQHIQKHIATFKRAHANRSRAISCMYMLCRRVSKDVLSVHACIVCIFCIRNVFWKPTQDSRSTKSTLLVSGMLKLLRAPGDLDRALFLDPLFIGRLCEKVIFGSPFKNGPGGSWQHIQGYARSVNSLLLVCSLSSHRHSYIHLIFSSRFIDS